MSLFIVKQHQRTTSQDFAGTPDESSRDQVSGIDGLTMAIDVETRGFLRCLLPEMGGPFSQRISETLCTTSLGQMSEKPLDVKVSIGTCASGEQAKGIASVAAQIARAVQTNGTKQP